MDGTCLAAYCWEKVRFWQLENHQKPCNPRPMMLACLPMGRFPTIVRALFIFVVIATIAIGYLSTVKNKLVEKEIKTVSEGINYVAFASEKPVHLHFG